MVSRQKTGSWEGWLSRHVSIQRTRARELIAIAGGITEAEAPKAESTGKPDKRYTVQPRSLEQVRADKAESVRKVRENHALRSRRLSEHPAEPLSNPVSDLEKLKAEAMAIIALMTEAELTAFIHGREKKVVYEIFSDIPIPGE